MATGPGSTPDQCPPRAKKPRCKGKKIALAGVVENEGKGKGIFPYLFFVLFLKGGQGEVAADQAYTATVGQTIILESN